MIVGGGARSASPRHLLAHFGAPQVTSIAAGALLAPMAGSRTDNFEAFANRAYGPSLPRLSLLNDLAQYRWLQW